MGKTRMTVRVNKATRCVWIAIIYGTDTIDMLVSELYFGHHTVCDKGVFRRKQIYRNKTQFLRINTIYISHVRVI